MKAFKMLFTFLILLGVAGSYAQIQELYISDAGNFDSPPWQILKFDANGENPQVFIDDHLAWPQDIVFLENEGTVLISNLNTNQIAKFDATTGAYLGDFATGISGPTRMKIHSDGLLYALQWTGTGKVFRYQLDGTFVDEFTSQGVTTSIGLDWDSQGNLYVSSYNNNLIRKFDTNGVDQGIFINSNLQGPTNIWFDENDNLYALNWNGSTVSHFDSEGNFIGSFITGLAQPEGVAFLENGNILIGNGGNGSVKMFGPSGNFLEDVVASGTANLLQPNAVVLREVIPNAISEITEETNFIYPSQGTAFYLDSAKAIDLKSIAIYHASGGLLKTVEVKSGLVWDASSTTAGTYILVGTTSDNRLLSQRVLVVK
ncbi:MAG: NHL repeat-containing protein [Saprospiraceae bacterium]|nr:NHL repeat-containing protein [Saprospiraceae bacterium]